MMKQPSKPPIYNFFIRRLLSLTVVIIQHEENNGGQPIWNNINYEDVWFTRFLPPQ